MSEVDNETTPPAPENITIFSNNIVPNKNNGIKRFFKTCLFILIIIIVIVLGIIGWFTISTKLRVDAGLKKTRADILNRYPGFNIVSEKHDSRSNFPFYGPSESITYNIERGSSSCKQGFYLMYVNRTPGIGTDYIKTPNGNSEFLLSEVYDTNYSGVLHFNFTDMARQDLIRLVESNEYCGKFERLRAATIDDSYGLPNTIKADIAQNPARKYSNYYFFSANKTRANQFKEDLYYLDESKWILIKDNLEEADYFTTTKK